MDQSCQESSDETCFGSSDKRMRCSKQSRCKFEETRIHFGTGTSMRSLVTVVAMCESFICWSIEKQGNELFATNK